MAEENVKIAVLEQKLNYFDGIVQKLDNAIEKISEVNANLIRMLAVHEEKIKQCNDTDDLIVRMVDSMKQSNIDEHNQVKKIIDDIVQVKISALENKVSKLPSEVNTTYIVPLEKKVEDASRIKWITIGCGAVLVVIAGPLSTFLTNWFVPKIEHQTPYPIPQVSTPIQK